MMNIQGLMKQAQMMQKKMEEAAEALEFEEAARYRDLFNSVKQVSQKQKITDSDGEDKDLSLIHI